MTTTMAERTDRRATQEDFDKYFKAKNDIPCGRYRHWKGGIYRVIAVTMSAETLEPVVVYCKVLPNGCDDNVAWSRPASEWYESTASSGQRYWYIDSNSNFR